MENEKRRDKKEIVTGFATALLIFVLVMLTGSPVLVQEEAQRGWNTYENQSYGFILEVVRKKWNIDIQCGLARRVSGWEEADEMSSGGLDVALEVFVHREKLPTYLKQKEEEERGGDYDNEKRVSVDRFGP
jgi:hypothetical protein